MQTIKMLLLICLSSRKVRQCCALQGAVSAVGYETAERFGGNFGLLGQFQLAWATSTMQPHYSIL